MQNILTLDMNNYQDCTKIFEVTHARAIICKDGKYAMQCGKDGEYKVPGGRLEQGEEPKQALIREVEEEVGLIVIPDSIREIGEIMEIRRDIHDASFKYICHNFYYSCDVKEELVSTKRSEMEIFKGYELKWGELEEMIRVNRELNMAEERIRDTVFFEKFLPLSTEL